MILLLKFIKGSIILTNTAHLHAVALQKSFFYSCPRAIKRILGKSYALTGVRYKTNHALTAKVSNATAQLIIRTKKSSELKDLIKLAAPEKWRVFGAIIFLLISSSVTMAVPFCLGKVIDTIYTVDAQNMKTNLIQLSTVLFCIFVVGGLSNFARVYLMSTAGHKITKNLREKAFTAILSQETAMFDKQSTGELVGRLTGDAALVSSAVTSNVSDGLRSGIMTIAGISMMVYVSPQLALIGLSIVPPVAGMAVLYGRFLKTISRDVQNGLAVTNAIAEERIANIRTVKAFAREKHEIGRYKDKLEAVLKLSYKESLYRGIFFGLTGLSGNAIILSVLYYGGIMVSNSVITIGNLSSFLLYAAYVGISINGISSFYTELNKALGASARLFELIARQPMIPIEGGKILNKDLSGEIRFENISFSYPARENILILNNFSLCIPKCSVIALVGCSGSGKSTIAALLLRLYDPNKGNILFDNHDLRDLNPVWVKSQIGFVSQEPILFTGTIKDNITYGNEMASKSEIEDAAKQANVAEFTDKMVDGLNTIVGERGITLSGGQRQRVAIARALLKKPKILVLDEATSALDAESENFVQQALERAAHGRTVLTIAHRLSTIRNADNIVVLDQGQVVEIGTYNELMTIEHGFFKKLVKHQMFS